MTGKRKTSKGSRKATSSAKDSDQTNLDLWDEEEFERECEEAAQAKKDHIKFLMDMLEGEQACLLWFDEENGEGEVFMTQEFLSYDGLFRADVTKDWSYLLDMEYETSVFDWHAEMELRREQNGSSD